MKLFLFLEFNIISSLYSKPKLLRVVTVAIGVNQLYSTQHFVPTIKLFE